MDNETIQVLHKIKNLFSDEKRWTQGTYARDIDGGYVREISEGYSFCLSGAITKYIKIDEYTSITDTKIYRELKKTIGGNLSISCYNDTVAKSVNDIILIIDKTLERLENEQ